MTTSPSFTALAFGVLLALGASGCKPGDPSPPAPEAAAPAATEPAPDMHTSRLSLDWPGVYKGTLPCADCPGIETVVTLNEDGRYSRHMRYMERSPEVFTDTGSFAWDDAGGVVILTSGEASTSFRVGENKLIMLDQEGRPITGALADHYVLTQLPSPTLEGTHWRLVSLNGAAVPETQAEPHLIFNAEDKRVHGSSGCNRLTGGYETTDGQGLRFAAMASTRMACLKGMDTEQAFLDALTKTQGYLIRDNSLALHQTSATPLATFEAVYLP